MPSTGPTIGPFHVLRGSEILYRLLAIAGVVLYASSPQESPVHGLSQTHSPDKHSPLRLQSSADLHLAKDIPKHAANTTTASIFAEQVRWRIEDGEVLIEEHFT